MKFDFQNKNIIITGGTGGIGMVVVEKLLESKANILVIASTRNSVKKTKKAFLAISDSAYFVRADISDSKILKKVKNVVQKKFAGKVDVLINAAGIYGSIGKFENLEPRDWMEAFKVNVFGTVNMCKLAIPLMKKRKQGKIINFSGGGDGPLPRFTAYSASKGAILRFTESLGAELKEDNIQVNAIAPGAVNSAFLEKVLKVGPKKAGEDFYKKAIQQKRTGGVSPEKAAELILFLSSEKSGVMTGKLISAVWDNWSKFSKRSKIINSSDIYNMRRVNPKDRGYDW